MHVEQPFQHLFTIKKVEIVSKSRIVAIYVSMQFKRNCFIYDLSIFVCPSALFDYGIYLILLYRRTSNWLQAPKTLEFESHV